MAATGSEIASAYVALTVKAPGLKKDIGKELGAVDTGAYGSQMGSKLADGMKKTLKVAAVGVAGVLGTALVKGFGRLKSIETAQAKMRGLGHDSKTVAKAMDNALKSVQGTAFGLGDAATVAGGAMAAQIKPGKELETHLSRIANNAAAAGIGFDEMGSIFNKAATQANGVQNDIIGQLADKGIPIYAELGKQMGVTAGEVFKLASEGKVSFEVFSKAAEAAAGTVAAEMGNTTTGAFDNMMAALGRLGAKILEDIFPLIGPLFKEITAKIDETATKVEPVVKWIGERLPAALDNAKTAFTDMFSWVASNKDWLSPVAVGIGSAALAVKVASAATSLWKGTTAAFAAVQMAYTAYTYGMAGATYTYTGASKAGAAATKVFGLAIKATPIGIVLTAITALVAGLVFFFTKTKTGKKIWAEFTRFLGEAWANISGFFTAAYENVIKPVFEGISKGVKAVGDFFVTAWTDHIKPVFDGIAAAAKWVWETILRPIFDVLAFAFAVMAGIIVGTYEALIKPMLDAFGKGVAWLNDNAIQPAILAIGAAFTWVSENVISPIVAGIKIYIAAWGAVIKWLYATVIKPVFDAIGRVFNWIWLNVIKPVVDWVVAYFRLWGLVFSQLWTNNIKPTIDAIGTAFRWLRDNVITPVWNAIKSTISGVWNNGIKPVIDTMVKIVRSDPKKAFEVARDGIKSAWDAIKEIAKKPVRFVVETVFGGLVDAVNGFLPKNMHLPRPRLPKGFSDGGYTGNIAANAVAGVVHGNEHVIKATSRRSIESKHPGLLDHMNRTGTVPGYRKGGLVHPLPGSVITTHWMGYPGHTGMDFAKPAGTPIQAAAAGIVSKRMYHGMYGNMIDLNHGAGFSTRYAHMLANMAVTVGQMVKAGQVIGYEGSTGNSTGPHLHFETLQNGSPMDPAQFLSGASSVKPAFGIVEGLLEGVVSKFMGAFPGGGFFVDAAGSVMRSGVQGAIDWISEKLSFGVGGGGLIPTLYDSGGWLQPGLSLVENKTGRPEPIFTGNQFDRMVDGGGGFESGTRLVLVLDDGTELGGYVERRAVQVVDRKLAPVSAGALASSHGRRV